MRGATAIFFMGAVNSVALKAGITDILIPRRQNIIILSHSKAVITYDQ